jgi:hypothetical protein
LSFWAIVTLFAVVLILAFPIVLYVVFTYKVFQDFVYIVQGVTGTSFYFYILISAVVIVFPVLIGVVVGNATARAAAPLVLEQWMREVLPNLSEEQRIQEAELEQRRRLVVRRGLAWFFAALLLSFTTTFVLAAYRHPPLPEVELAWDPVAWPEKDIVQGRVLTTTGGFWYVFDNKDNYNLVAIPNSEIDTVRFDDAAD